MKLPKGTKLAIRQALEITHSASESNAILTRTQTLYNSFIREAPAPGGMNLLRPHAKKHGYEHLMPLFCGSDFKVAERYGMRLIREHTEAEGFPNCDFWYLMADDAER